MRQNLEKICLGAIYLGIAITLALPLFVDNSFFFPFVTTKAFIFRIVAEAMLLAYLMLLAASSERYRPKFHPLNILITLFILTATLSSWLGGNLVLSFWGDMERSEGLLFWLHLWIYMLILISAVRTEKAWTRLMDFSLGIGILLSLFGIGQALHLKSLLATSGSRVDATVGNPAFLAGYMLFLAAFALYLFFRRQSILAKAYYAILIVLFGWVILATQTRGSVIGLVMALVLAGCLLALGSKDNPKVRKFAFGAVIFVLAFGSLIFFARKQSWIQESAILGRIVSISSQERTAQTRLATWEAAWKGWREKFWLGYGLENFDTVFNKNFPPIIYGDEGSQVWFDRAHNLIFDRGVTTGIAGLLIYLAFLFYPVYRLFQKYRRPEQDSDRAAPVIFICLVAAFFIQDLFVFETITTYVILFFTWSFFAAVLLPEKRPIEIKLPEYASIGALVVYGVLLWPVLWYVNIYPAKINIAAAKAMSMNPRDEDFFKIVDNFKIPVDARTYGRQEYRIQFVEFVDNQLAGAGEVVPQVKPVVAYTDEEIQKQIRENPTNAKNYLLAMRHYNNTFAADPATKVDRIQKALSFFPRLQELSPTRPHIYQEAGYSHLYLYRFYKDKHDQENALKEYPQAEEFFKKTIDLNPKVVESYVNLVMLYLNAAEDEKVAEVIGEMDERHVAFRKPKYLSKMYNLALSTERLRWVGYFSEEQTKLNAGDVQAWINLAVFYATNGNRAKAIEIAGKIKEFGGDYVRQADLFIASVNKGEYEKK